MMVRRPQLRFTLFVIIPSHPSLSTQYPEGNFSKCNIRFSYGFFPVCEQNNHKKAINELCGIKFRVSRLSKQVVHKVIIWI